MTSTTTATMNMNEHPYSHHRAIDEEAARRYRHDSAATLRASVSSQLDLNTSHAATAVLPVPSKDNEWLGFCPSAVKLQNGDRKGALKKRTDYHDSYAASGVNTYACSAKGCAFQGHVSVEVVWRVVMPDERLGLKCRWAFLAKSHMKAGMVTGRQYHFQCPICIFQNGHAEGRLWKGASIYLEHLSTHRGKDISQEVLHKLNLVNDHVADDKEDFDLNLFPTSPSSPPQPQRVPLLRTATRGSMADSLLSVRKDSSGYDIASGLQRFNTNRSERADSVLSTTIHPDDTPWSEGLSEFKMDREEDYLSADF